MTISSITDYLYPEFYPGVLPRLAVNTLSSVIIFST